MRDRTRARLWKAARRAERRHPGFGASLLSLERGGLPVNEALRRLVAEPAAPLEFRALAARLLRDISNDHSSFVPLLVELIAAGDCKFIELIVVIEWMWYRISRPAFEVLRVVLMQGTPEQRFWVTLKIARFYHHQVGRALIELLNDTEAPARVRAGAAEMLHLHISRKTVQACSQATNDPSAEVRFSAVSTLGIAARWRPAFRAAAIAILEKMQSDKGVGSVGWTVGREAQCRILSARGTPEAIGELRAEMQAILADPAASMEDRKWVTFTDALEEH